MRGESGAHGALMSPGIARPTTRGALTTYAVVKSPHVPPRRLTLPLNARSLTLPAPYAAARRCCSWIARRMSNRSRAASTWRPRASDHAPSARIGAASVAPSGVSA
jgi:hypothetical protein